jgi:hypothetical protein
MLDTRLVLDGANSYLLGFEDYTNIEVVISVNNINLVNVGGYVYEVSNGYINIIETKGQFEARELAVAKEVAKAEIIASTGSYSIDVEEYLIAVEACETIEAVETAKIEAIEAIEATIASYVALVGNVGYTSVVNALNAAQAGDVVTLLNNVELTSALVLDKEITLDGNGYTLTSTADRAINVNCAKEVTIKNLTIVNGSNVERAINVIQKPATLVIDNVEAEGFKYAINVAASAKGSLIEINNSTISGYAAINISNGADYTTLNVKDSVLTGVNEYNNAKENSFSVITVEGEYSIVTVEGGNIVAKTTNEALQCIMGSSKGNLSNATIMLDTRLVLDGANSYLLGFEDYTNIEVLLGLEYTELLSVQGYCLSVE